MEISIFNLNCWLLPAPFSTDRKVRRSAIADLILLRRPDIVTLQEVWANSDVTYLKQRLSAYHCISSGSRLYNQSGLVTFVKAEPISKRTTFYKRSIWHNVTEWIARKGYIEADIKIHGVIWTVVNTHLYAHYLKRAERIAKEQFAGVVSRVSSTKSILCGDLNLREAELEKVSNGRLVRLCGSENTFDGLNPYKQPRFNAFASEIEGGKIDYITCAAEEISPSAYQVIRTPFVSDHYPIYCLATIV